MKKSIICVVMTLLLTQISVVAQDRVSLHADYDLYFDNKEYSATNYGDKDIDIEKGTDFLGRLVLSTELEWESSNSLVIGADLRNNFGEVTSKFFSYAKPIIYYKYKDESWKLVGGIFRNCELHIDSYSTAFYSESYRNVNDHINGVLAQYVDGDSYVEFACNWSGEYSESSREKFEILSAGRYYIGKFYGGYNYLMYHFAGSADGLNGALVDLQRLNPYVGFSEKADVGVELKLGAIISPQRDRNYATGWVTPIMGEAAVAISYKGFVLDERFYFGDNLNPFFDGHILPSGYHMEYGLELYPSESFFRTDKGVYNRASVSYNRTFWSEKLHLRIAAITHYDGYGLGTQYILGAKVRLFQDIYNANNIK